MHVIKRKTMVAKIATARPRLLIGTRKGAFFLDSSDNGQSWQLSGPEFLGHIIHHVVADSRNASVVLMAAKTGHLGPTVFRSLDGGATWVEASSPPAFPKVDGAEHVGEKGRAVNQVFWVTPGHASEKSVWYAGTSPPGLFRSQDDGATWEPVSGFNDAADYDKWCASGETPGGQPLHSIIVDPRDCAHMYISISVGGTFESENKGSSWKPLNAKIAAEFMPDPDVEYGHDPHCLVQHPGDLDKLYQQNHCGIYRMDRPSRHWIRIGDNMPKEVGDIGFPMVPHPRDPERVWVFPMDGTTVWPRTSPDGKPAVYGTEDSGNSWKRLDCGLPSEHGYFTVKRQCMTADSCEKVGLYFGTTSGEVWASIDEGQNWMCIARYLPEIYSLTIQEKQ